MSDPDVFDDVELEDDELEDDAPAAGTWWHAYGRVRTDLGDVWQFTVYSGGTAGPEVARLLGGPGAGPYLGSWDHEPTRAERNAVTPEEFHDQDDDEEHP